MEPVDALLLAAPLLVLLAADRWLLRDEHPDSRRRIWRQWLASVFLIASAPLVIGVIGTLVFRHELELLSWAPRWFGAIGLVASVVVPAPWFSWRRARHGLDLLLEQPGPERFVVLARALDELGRRGGSHLRMSFALEAATTLSRANLLQEAETILAHSFSESVGPEWQYPVAHTRAWLAVQALDARRARSYLASLARPAPWPDWEERLALVDALADVVAGRPERALELVARHEHLGLSANWLAVLAHAQAATGDHEGARITLKTLATLRDPFVDLSQVASTPWPAAKLAAELLRGEPHPFR